MSRKAALVLLSGLSCACVLARPAPAAGPSPPSAAAAQPAKAPSPIAATQDRYVDIRGATCRTLLKLAPDDRVEAAMFYIGYQASRLRARTINVGLIPSMQIRAFDYCTAFPDRPVAQAFQYAYLHTIK